VSARTLPDDRLTRALLTAGVVVGPLTCSVFTVEGRRREGYSPRRHPVSALALGPRGWVQTANFLISGPMTVAAAVGLRRSLRPGRTAAFIPAAVAAAGLGLIGAGFFPTDPVPGYPDPDVSNATGLHLRSVGRGLDPTGPNQTGLDPTLAGPAGVPDRPLTRTGSLHVLSAVPFFVGLPFACLAGAVTSAKNGKRGSATFLGAAAVASMAGSSAAAAGFGGRWGLEETGGWWQRVSVAAGFAGLGGLATRSLRTGSSRRRG